MALAGAEIIFTRQRSDGWLTRKPSRARHNTALGKLCSGATQLRMVAGYFATANRVGVEGAIEFWGQSFIADPYGQVMQRAPVAEEAILYADCDLSALESTRQTWPFFAIAGSTAIRIFSNAALPRCRAYSVILGLTHDCVRMNALIEEDFPDDYRWPAEWEPQAAIWFAWPVREDLWSGVSKLCASNWCSSIN